MNEIKPLSAIIISLLTGFLVAHGNLNASDSQALTQSLDTLIGGTIIVIGALGAIHRYVVIHPLNNKPLDSVQQTNNASTQSSPAGNTVIVPAVNVDPVSDPVLPEPTVVAVG